MTNNELMRAIFRKIDEAIDERILIHKRLINEKVKNCEYSGAHLFQSYCRENEVMRGVLKEELQDFILSLDLDTANTPHKEMWEELKEEIKRSKSEYENAEEGQCNAKLYHFATMSKAKKMEDADILSVMDEIEAERGIEND